MEKLIESNVKPRLEDVIPYFKISGRIQSPYNLLDFYDDVLTKWSDERCDRFGC